MPNAQRRRPSGPLVTWAQGIAVGGLCVLLLAACAAPRDQLLVGAASSLEPLFQELEIRFEDAHDIDVVRVTGASGALAEQVRQGAPLDLFVSANEAFARSLVEQGLALDDRLTPFAEGRLALATSLPVAPTADWRDIVLDSRVSAIAIAHPETAPYGAAARAAMEAAGVWDRVASRAVYGANVSQALQFAADGSASAAFVASSQVAAGLADGLNALPIDADAYPALTQVAIVPTSTDAPDLANQFLDWLLSAAVQALLVEYGYEGTALP